MEFHDCCYKEEIATLADAMALRHRAFTIAATSKSSARWQMPWPCAVEFHVLLI
jgi:hypothetical protein